MPAMDAVPTLTMADMMGAMAHGGMSGMSDMVKVHHARSEYQPGVDMHVNAPRINLDDPGVGLRDNGRRVLTYADLHSLERPTDSRDAHPRDRVAPDRQHGALHLVVRRREVLGCPADSFQFRRAAAHRARSTTRMMNHPIHLHGMFGELENPHGR